MSIKLTDELKIRIKENLNQYSKEELACILVGRCGFELEDDTETDRLLKLYNEKYGSDE